MGTLPKILDFFQNLGKKWKGEEFLNCSKGRPGGTGVALLAEGGNF